MTDDERKQNLEALEHILEMLKTYPEDAIFDLDATSPDEFVVYPGTPKNVPEKGSDVQ